MLLASDVPLVKPTFKVFTVANFLSRLITIYRRIGHLSKVSPILENRNDCSNR